MGFDSSRPDYAYYSRVSDAISTNPGVFKDEAERQAFSTVVNHFISSATDARVKSGIADKAANLVKSGLAGGISAALKTLLAFVF